MRRDPSERAAAPPRREPAVWLVAPGALFFVVIVGIPLVIVVWTSFLRIGLGEHARLDGLSVRRRFRNYANGLTGPNVLGVSALESVWISVKFSLLATPASTPIALFAALSVYHKFRGRALLRSIYLVPYVIPGFVVALLAQIAFLNQYGPVDKLLATLHIAPVGTFWLIGPNAFWAMTFVEVWEVWPFIYLLLLAGLAGDPQGPARGSHRRRRRLVVQAQVHRAATAQGRVRAGVLPVHAVSLRQLHAAVHAVRQHAAHRPWTCCRSTSTTRDSAVSTSASRRRQLIFNILLLAVPAAVYLWIARLRPAGPKEVRGIAT